MENDTNHTNLTEVDDGSENGHGSFLGNLLDRAIVRALIVILVVYALAQFYAAWVGIEYHLGFWWAVAAFFAIFALRLIPILLVGAFFGAKDVWGWHWALALFFVAPALVFAVPAAFAEFVATLVEEFKWRRVRRTTSLQPRRESSNERTLTSAADRES